MFATPIGNERHVQYERQLIHNCFFPSSAKAILFMLPHESTLCDYRNIIIPPSTNIDFAIRSVFDSHIYNKFNDNQFSNDASINVSLFHSGNYHSHVPWPFVSINYMPAHIRTHHYIQSNWLWWRGFSGMSSSLHVFLFNWTEIVRKTW